jgi:hypothetical protein
MKECEKCGEVDFIAAHECHEYICSLYSKETGSEWQQPVWAPRAAIAAENFAELYCTKFSADLKELKVKTLYKYCEERHFIVTITHVAYVTYNAVIDKEAR